MLNRNLLITGIVVGVLLPLTTFMLLYQVFTLLEIKGAASSSGLSPDFRERTLAILAIAINLIPLNIYRRKRWELAIRGVVIATYVLAVSWVIYFGPGLL
jgi:hypothetical protein